MLSNIDCDFLGEKQPALVNLDDFGPMWTLLALRKVSGEVHFSSSYVTYTTIHKPNEMTVQSQNFASQSIVSVVSLLPVILDHFFKTVRLCAALCNINQTLLFAIRCFII